MHLKYHNKVFFMYYVIDKISKLMLKPVQKTVNILFVFYFKDNNCIKFFWTSKNYPFYFFKDYNIRREKHIKYHYIFLLFLINV